MSHVVRVKQCDFGECSAWELKQVLRPVGNYRFLTPLDRVQPGDLYRVTVLPGEADDGQHAYNSNWTAVHSENGNIGVLVGDLPPVCEFIRGIADESSAVPFYELIHDDK